MPEMRRDLVILLYHAKRKLTKLLSFGPVMEIDKIIIKFTRSDKNDFRETFPDEIIPKSNENTNSVGVAKWDGHIPEDLK